MRENDKEEKVKPEMDEIETINTELEHSVAKLLSENEHLHKEIGHLKKIYKDKFGLIKKTRALSKEHDDSLIAQLNSKSMENADLKRQIQDKGSNATDVPSSSSLVNDMLSKLFSGIWTPDGLGHNLFLVGQFCDTDLEVSFRKNTCYIPNLEGVDLLSGSKDINLYTISLNDILKTSLICLILKASKTKSWLWHLRLSHLNFGTLNKLAKDGLSRGIPKLKFQKDHLYSACALGKSKKSSPQPKAEDTNQEKLYLLHMDLYGPMRVESINGKKYTSFNRATLALAQKAIKRGLAYSTMSQLGYMMLALESPKTPHFHDDPLHESLHEDSTSHGSSSNVRPSHTPFEHLGRWTKDHPMANVIGDPSRSVSTRKQLETDAMWCYFDAFLTSIEPKNFKQAMTKPSWIDEMQEEVHEFERLQVWELVSYPDKVMLIKLKWIYMVKTYEFGGALKNKARLVAQGSR
ncbi:retrovirus-related pol polyprotein from transposon TNT 1-94 [Tanacetum coccineum]